MKLPLSSLSRAGFFVAGLAALSLPAVAQIVQLDSYTTAPSGGEIVAYDRSSRLLYVTAGAQGTAGVEIVNAANPANLTQTGVIDLSSVGGLNSYSVSSVAADPLGRGFGVATFIPELSGSNPGKVVFFDPVARTVLHTVDVGYHPDMIKFSGDGSKLFVANEGEPVSEAGPVHFDRPGSISVVDLAGVASPAQVPTLGPAQVSTYDFSAANLAAGVDVGALRVHPSNNSAAGRVNDIEPEYITQAGDKLYVSLQENNAVAEFDLTQGKWTRVDSLGTLQKTIDASSNDGGVHIDDTVAGLPLPDGLASVTVGGKTFYLTANEGDARPADRVGAGHPNGATDEARFQQLGAGGRPALDAVTDATLDALYGGNAQADSALGRLRVSLIDGNLDADPQIEQPTMFGTRSFSIWDADTGALVSDSGSDFEFITGNAVLPLYNSNGTAVTFDARSQNKGPEPEGITTGLVGDQLWAFIGLERVGGVMAYDISDPTRPLFRTYFNTGELSPEGLEFVSALESPTGFPLLYVGYEVGGAVGAYQIMVPESGARLPVAVGLALGGAAFGVRRFRRGARR
jgi:hypothetical protein